MRTLVIVCVSALVAGLLGYVSGGYFTAKRLARDTNYATLLWLTSIDSELQAGQIERARRTALIATDGTLSLLSGLDQQSAPILMTVFGAFDFKHANEITATRAKRHFLPNSMTLSDESRAFLERVVEVEIPTSSCSAKKKDEGEVKP